MLLLGKVRGDQEKGHHPINFSLYPGQSFQNGICLLCKEAWAHTPPLTHATTQREGLHSAQVMRPGQRVDDASVRLQGAQSSRRQGAQCRSSLFRCGEVTESITETPRTVAANENCCIACLKPGFLFPRNMLYTKGNVQENGLAQKKIKIGCLVLNSNFPKLVG